MYSDYLNLSKFLAGLFGPDVSRIIHQYTYSARDQIYHHIFPKLGPLARENLEKSETENLQKIYESIHKRKGGCEHENVIQYRVSDYCLHRSEPIFCVDCGLISWEFHNEYYGSQIIGGDKLYNMPKFETSVFMLFQHDYVMILGWDDSLSANPKWDFNRYPVSCLMMLINKKLI